MSASVVARRAPPGTLVVFAGLPGTGKTTVARAVADRLGSTFVRIDTIEAAIQHTLAPFHGNPVGYVAAEWIAQDQLVGGRSVVVDAVNNVEVARQHWRDLATRTESRLFWVEVVCTDAGEHRRRVEARSPDWPGQGNPTWEQVCRRGWEPFSDERLLVDNDGPVPRSVEAVLAHLGRPTW